MIRGEWADLLGLDPAVTPIAGRSRPVAGSTGRLPLEAACTATNAAANIGVVSDSATNETFILFDAVITTLGALLIVTSLAGVFDTVLLETRQRTRETAVLKALGMTPRQVVSSVLASLVPVGLLAGIVGVPLGLALQRVVLGFMGQAASGTGVPAQAIDVLADGHPRRSRPRRAGDRDPRRVAARTARRTGTILRPCCKRSRRCRRDQPRARGAASGDVPSRPRTVPRTAPYTQWATIRTACREGSSWSAGGIRPSAGSQPR